MSEEDLRRRLEAPPAPGAPRLFAFPAQSNFSGVQHPLEWIPQARARGWDVLLDASAFAPTNRLDVARWRPDFVAVSFYKLFGYPTGVGCLIARNAGPGPAAPPLVRRRDGDPVLGAPGRPPPRRRTGAFEDGTVNYLGLPAVSIGLRHLRAVGLTRSTAACAA